MATTKARKTRRLKLKERHEEIEIFLSAYVRDPGVALKSAFEKFGRERFERTLQQYISRHTIKSALSFTMQRCLKEAA